MTDPLIIVSDLTPGSLNEAARADTPTRSFERWLIAELGRLEARMDRFVTPRSLRRYLLGPTGSNTRAGRSRP